MSFSTPSRRFRFWLIAGLLTLQSVLRGAPALADGELRDDPRAREFFEVGAQAYNKGQYVLAIDAFQQAYALTERPGLLFSLAQAYQRQFRATGDESLLLKAIDAYRKYLTRVDAGGRRADAERALASLLPLMERLGAQGSGSDTTTHAKVFGRLLLSSATPEAKITVNGEPVETLPTSLELPEDHYKVIAQAPGFERRVQDVVIVAGSAVPLSIELKPLPTRLELTGPTGAEVLVDGSSTGWLPIGVLSLPPGEHWVSLRKSGFQTRTALAKVERGKTTKLSIALETTFQRKAVWVSLGGAALATGLTATFSVLAWKRDSEAEKLESRRIDDGLTSAEGNELNRDVVARDRFKTYALVSGIGAASLLGVAAVLYLADSPASPPTHDMRAAQSTSRFHVEPILGSTLGLAASARF